MSLAISTLELARASAGFALMTLASSLAQSMNAAFSTQNSHYQIKVVFLGRQHTSNNQCWGI
jgi:hypothetical protein